MNLKLFCAPSRFLYHAFNTFSTGGSTVCLPEQIKLDQQVNQIQKLSSPHYLTDHIKLDQELDEKQKLSSAEQIKHSSSVYEYALCGIAIITVVIIGFFTGVAIPVPI